MRDRIEVDGCAMCDVGGRGKCHDFVHKSAVIIVSNHGHAAVT